MLRTIYLRPGDRVHLSERRDGEFIPRHALVLGISMNERLLGERKRPAIRVVSVFADGSRSQSHEIEDVVHVSHPDWMEERTAFAYDEAPVVEGQCRYCGCTDTAPCIGGCSWLDAPTYTRCSAPRCARRFREDIVALAEHMTELGQ